MQLRDYQEDLLGRTRASLRHNNRTLMVLPTGGGKTVIFSYMASRASAQGARCVILVHRDELIDQVAATLEKFGVRCTFVAPGRVYRTDIPVVVASVFTLKNRLLRVPSPKLLIIDEAHHCTLKSSWGAVLTAWNESKVVGVSATPQRLSGEGLGEVFQDMVVGPTTAELIERKSLSEFDYFVPDHVDVSGVKTQAGDFKGTELSELMSERKITARAVSACKELADGKRTVVFCVNLDHCTKIRDEYRAAGYRAETIHGGLDPAVRRDMVRRFSRGEVSHLVSCNVVSEGFDLPAIECVQLMRPTMSLSLYLQQVGRGLRVFPGKARAIILDHAGNCTRHGFPDSARAWSLEGKRMRKRDSVTVRTFSCEKCFFTAAAPFATCPNCGLSSKEAPKEIKEEDGKLIHVTSEQRKAYAKAIALQKRKEQGAANSFESLVKLATERNYKYPREWALRILAARKNKTTSKTWQT